METKQPITGNGCKNRQRISKQKCFLFMLVGISLLPLAYASPLGWTDDLQITFNPAMANQEKLAVDSDKNVHIVWFDERHGYPNREIYYKKLNSNGVTLVADKRLTNNPGHSGSPVLAVDSNNNVHIVWEDDRGVQQLYYMKLDNNGNILIPEKRITFSSTWEYFPRIAIDRNNNLHITWFNQNNIGTVYYKKLDNNGNTLVNDRQINSLGPASGGTLAVDSNNNVHVVWADGRDHQIGYAELYYKKLDNNGNTIVNDLRLTTSRTSVNPEIAFDSNNHLHILWRKFDTQTNKDELYYKKLDNNGNMLVSDKRLSDDPQNPIPPGQFTITLDVDSNNQVHAVWKQSVGSGNHELFYVRLDQNGTRLLNNTRLTNASGYSNAPSLGIDAANTLHLAWQDTRIQPAQLFYKRTTPVKPVLLLHGVCSNPSIWLSDKQNDPNYVLELFNNGFFPLNVDYAPGTCTKQNPAGPECANGDIRKYASFLSQEIQRVKQQYNVQKVDIVAHSMGGLISRFYMKQFGSDNVNQLIMLGTPNHGSVVPPVVIRRFYQYADFLRSPEATECFSQNADQAPAFSQMNPQSSFLSLLNYDLSQWDYSRWLTEENIAPAIYRNIAGYRWGTSDLYKFFGLVKPTISPGDMIVPVNLLKLRNRLADCRLSTSSDADQKHWNLHSNRNEFGTVLNLLQNPTQPRMDNCGYMDEDNTDSTTIEFSPLETGAIAQNQQKTHVFYADGSVVNVSFSLGWKDPNNQLKITLRDPDNILIDRSSQNALFTDVPARTFVEINYVKVGNWTMIIDGTTVSGAETYDAGATYISQKALIISVTNSTIKPNDQTIILSFFTSTNGTILPSIAAKATITKPNQQQDIITLFDDGLHGDGAANDGIFGNFYQNTAQEGTYDVTVLHSFTQESTYEKKTLFEVKLPVDVAVLKITPSTPPPSPYQNITITAEVSNDNIRDVNNVSVSFYENGLFQAEQRVNLLRNERKSVIFPWSAKAGSTVLAVIINPLGQDFEESNYDNNRKSEDVWVEPIMELLP